MEIVNRLDRVGNEKRRRLQINMNKTKTMTLNNKIMQHRVKRE